MGRNENNSDFPFCQWELIKACNMQCDGCRVSLGAPLKQPSLEIVKRTIDDLVIAGVSNLEFIGGEPPLYKKFPAVLEYLNMQPKIEKFAVLTNATAKELLERIRPHLSFEKGGLVVSINYTLEQCEYLLKAGIDIGMVKKSIAGWEALEAFNNCCWIRVNCAVNSLNIENIAEIAERVIKFGGYFSFCPLIYRRQGYDSGLEMTFRSSSAGFALTDKHKKSVEKAMFELRELKRKYPMQIIPTNEYMKLVVESCKNPTKSYPASCNGLGLPYLRISSEIGKSLHNRKKAFRLRACSDIIGSEISKIVTSDLRNWCIRKSLPLIYQRDPEVIKCCHEEGCVWSVTHLLSLKE